MERALQTVSGAVVISLGIRKVGVWCERGNNQVEALVKKYNKARI